MTKKNIWRYIPFDTFTAAENMAIDEMILEKVAKKNHPNTIRFYQWKKTTASIGRNQSLLAEIDEKELKERDFDFVRRISGGGAVLHDAKYEITYAIICRIPDMPEQYPKKIEFKDNIPDRYQIILESLAEGLRELGVSIDAKKIHCPALLMNGKKISGNAQAIRKNTLLQHGTILLKVDPEVMYKVLKAPEGVSYTKMVQSVRSKVAGILDVSESSEENIHGESSVNTKKTQNEKENELKPHEIVQYLKQGFQKIFDIKLREQPLKKEERKEIKKLEKKRYKNDEWTNRFP